MLCMLLTLAILTPDCSLIDDLFIAGGEYRAGLKGGP